MVVELLPQWMSDHIISGDWSAFQDVDVALFSGMARREHAGLTESGWIGANSPTTTA